MFKYTELTVLNLRTFQRFACYYSRCCNPATCKLKPGAACDEGICCENCQFMSRNVKCREKLDECDFPEYCTGESGYVSRNCNCSVYIICQLNVIAIAFSAVQLVLRVCAVAQPKGDWDTAVGVELMHFLTNFGLKCA